MSATSASGLAEAMSRTANAANLAGVSMDKLLGYLAVVGETTQKQMSEVGTSFQAIFSRMGNVAAGKDIDSEGESLNNVETVLTKVGIKLRDSQSQFRNFGSVLDEIAGKWKGYSNVEQNQIATAVAGTRQRENFLVLMQNYSKATEYATTAQESNGSAMKKMEVYENSLEAATKRATAAWESFSSSILNSGLVKFFIDLGAGALNLGSTLGATTLAVTALTIAFIAFRNSSLITSVGVLSLQLGEAVPILGRLTQGLITATGASGALATAMDMIPLLAIVGACIAAYKAFDYFNVTIEEQKQKVEELSNAYETSKSDLENINTQLKTAQDRIDELNKKPKLSFVEQSELDKLKETTKELQLQQDIADKKSKSAAMDLANANVDLYNKQFGQGQVNKSAVNDYINSAQLTGNNAILTSDTNNISAMLAAYKQFSDLKKQAFSNKDNAEVERYDELLKEINKSLFDDVDGLQKIQKNIEAIPESDRTESQKKVLEDTANGIKLVYESLDPKKWKDINFNSVFGDKAFSSVKTELSNLAKQGKLTADTLNDPKYQNFKDSLSKVGISAKDTADQINALNSVTKNSSVNNIESVLSSLDAKYKDISTSVSSYASNVKELNTAIDNQNKGDLLSGETVSELIQKYPQLSNKIIDTGYGYKFQKGALEEVRKAQIAEQTTSINAAISDAQNVLTSVQSQINSYSNLIGAIKSVADAKAKLAQINNSESSKSGFIGPTQNGPEKFALNQYVDASNKITDYQNKLNALKKSTQLVGQNNYEKVDTSGYNKEEKSGESEAKKAAQALKDQYNTELKQIETNKELGKYDKDRMGYYNALLALQKKYANTKLEQDTKLELQQKVYGALKDYEQQNLDLSYKELQNRIDLGVVQENSKAVLQNLLEIQENLNSSSMSLVNTEENRLEIAKKIYDVQKAMREQDKSNIDSLMSETESMVKQQYDAEKERHQTKLENLKSEYDAEKDALDKELDAIKNKIKLQEDALQKQKDERSHNEDQAAKEKAVADLQSKIAIAKNDTSDAGVKNVLDLQNQLATAQKALTDFQYDYSIDQQKQALEDAQDNYEKQYQARQDELEKEYKSKENHLQKEIDAVEKEASSEVNIRKAAMDLINSKAKTFYSDLIAYNQQYGDKTNNEMVNLWDSAYNSLSNYGAKQIDVLATLEKITSKMPSYSNASNTINTKATRNKSSIASDGTYTVKKGDTLSKIADWFGISLSDLKSANSNIKSVNVGQKVNIPHYANGTENASKLFERNEQGYEAMWIPFSSSQFVLADSEGSRIWKTSETDNLKLWSQMNPRMLNTSNITTNNSTTGSPYIDLSINVAGNVDNDVYKKIEAGQRNAANNALNVMKSIRMNTGTVKNVFNN